MKGSSNISQIGGQIAIRDKVFVGGLDFNVNEDQFRKHFEQFGDIKEC